MNVQDSLVALGQAAPVLAIQSTLLLWLALAAGSLLRKRGPAVQVLVYRAALVGVILLGVFSLTGVRKYSGLSRIPAADTTTVIPLPQNEPPASPAATASAGAVEVLPAVTRTDRVTVGSVAESVGFAWTVVAGMILAWTFGCHAILWMLRRRSTPAMGEAQAVLTELCSRQNIRQPLLLTGPWVRGPFLDGLVTPAILFPRGYPAHLSGDALRAVLAHELVHLVRGDCWWNLVSRITCALGWMQPLLWLLHRRLEQAAEEACDQEVLSHGLSAREYARCLTELAEWLLPTVPARVAGATVVPFRSGLGRRVKQILESTGPRRAPGAGARAAVGSGAVLALGMVTGLISAQPPATAGGARETPNGGFVGRVVHQDGRPAAKVKVFASMAPHALRREQGMMGIGMTDEAGNYRLRGLKEGEFTVFLLRPSQEWAAVAVRANARTGQPGSAPDLVLTSGALLKGRVVDPAGAPVEGVYVTSEGPDRPDAGRPFSNQKTDAQGRFQLRVSPGKTVLWLMSPVDQKSIDGVENPLGSRAEVSVVAGETRDVVLRVDGQKYAGAVISGRVVHQDGKPAPGIRVMAQLNDSFYEGNGKNQNAGAFSWSEDVTGPDGSYRLPGLMAAPYNVSVEEPTGEWTAIARERVLAVQGAGIRPTELTLTRGGLVSGTVVEEATGKPVPGVSIGSYGPHRPRSSAMIISAVTGKDGRYQLRVAPGGSYLYVQDSRHGAGLNANVTVAEGEVVELPFRVKTVPPDTD